MNTFFITLVCFFTSVVLSACGGGGSDPVAVNNANTVQATTVPALGAVYGASVSIHDVAGRPLGTGTTDTLTGKATLTLPGTASGPFIYKVVLGSGSRYYDEGQDAVLTIKPGQSLTLLSLASSTSAEVGVTALSNLALRLAGISPEMLESGAVTDFSLDKLHEAQATVIAILGLPADFDLFAAPVAASANNKQPKSAYGKLLAQMAINAEPGTNAFEQAAQLADAMSSLGVVANAKPLMDLNQAFLKSAASMGLVISDSKALIQDPALLAQRVALVKKGFQAKSKPAAVVTAAVPKAGGSASTSGTGTATLN